MLVPGLLRRLPPSQISRANSLAWRHYCPARPSLSQTAPLSPSADGRDTFYITTPIYYVNGQPHLGHAYTNVVADVLARYHRLLGKKVHFLTGTDEHGQKVEQSATKANRSPIEFADEVSDQFRRLTAVLHCSNDDFIRTTEARHRDGVVELWKKLEEGGHIYLGSYAGWYSVRDEAYYTEDELVDGKAPTGAEVQWVTEESYFFRLSAFTQRLLKHYEENPGSIAPATRRNEVVAFLSQAGGLRDLSISRTTFSWGIPVPGNHRHVVYVWLDALVNYLSALGYPAMGEKEGGLAAFWPADVQLVGKDILRFHAVYWPAFLMAAGLPLPKRVLAHGWWTMNGEKMSKSLGNVLDPLELVQMYGADYVRYFLVSEVGLGSDGDFSHEIFCQRINGDLANDLGNLVNRVVTLLQKHCAQCVPTPTALTVEDEQLLRGAKEAVHTITGRLLQQQALKPICEDTIRLAKLGNRYIDTMAPWNLAKQGNMERLGTVLYVLADVLRACAIYLSPVVPTAAGKIFQQLGVPPALQTLASISQPLPSGLRTGRPEPIFPRLERSQGAPVVAPATETRTKPHAAPATSARQAMLEEKYAAVTSTSDLQLLVEEIGKQVRARKAENVNKASLQPLVEELLFLKEKAAKAA